MDIESVRKHCMSFPHVTETVQWENELVFKVGGKMFAVASLEPIANVISFKCSPEDFADLTEQEEISPAPYLARAHWVALRTFHALPASELRLRLQQAYDLVLARLPKKQRLALTSST